MALAPGREFWELQWLKEFESTAVGLDNRVSKLQESISF